MNANWIFEHNQLGATEGPNDPGIAQFTGDRMGALVRELLQNSIDARAGDAPVIVDFEIVDAPIASLAIDELRDAIEASIASEASESNDDKHREQFRRGSKLLDAAQKSGTIQCLAVTDRNTTGASDRYGERDRWHNLTKSKGKSVKDTQGAGGSFGIGKHSAFAVTDLRTVFYSTAYQDGGKLARRFIGKAILVSHRIGNNHHGATGYLANSWAAKPLEDGDVPSVKPFRLDKPGTAAIIPGFKVDGRNRGRWGREAIETVLTHFFPAIAQGSLIVHIDGKAVRADTMDALADEVNLDDGVRKLIAVSRSNIVEHTHIEGIGKVNLRIEVDESQVYGNRSVALARDSGMVITRRLGSMRRGRRVQMLSFGGRWYSFTAIVECISGDERSLLREAEGPRHDSISPDFADESERGEVREGLRRLGEWVMDAIGKHARPPAPLESENPEEMRRLLPLPSEAGPASSDPAHAEIELTDPVQTEQAPRGLSSFGFRTPRRRPRSDGGNGEPRSARRARPRRRPNKKTPPRTAIVDLRRLPTTRAEAPRHTARFAFDALDTGIKRLRLFSIGEDNRRSKVHVERAYIDDRKVRTRDGDIINLAPEQLRGGGGGVECK